MQASQPIFTSPLMTSQEVWRWAVWPGLAKLCPFSEIFKVFWLFFSELIKYLDNLLCQFLSWWAYFPIPNGQILNKNLANLVTLFEAFIGKRTYFAFIDKTWRGRLEPFNSHLWMKKWMKLISQKSTTSVFFNLQTLNSRFVEWLEWPCCQWPLNHR